MRTRASGFALASRPHQDREAEDQGLGWGEPIESEPGGGPGSSVTPRRADGEARFSLFFRLETKEKS